MKMTLTGLVLFVLGLNIGETDRIHIYVPTPMTWNQAYSYCSQYYAAPSTITSEEEHQKLVAATEGTYFNAWIGLIRAGGNPKALMWSGGEQYSFTKLNGNDKDVSCVYATQLEWYMGNCLNTLPFFCHYYYSLQLVMLNMAWEEALIYCRDQLMDLASVTNKYELEILQYRTKPSTTEGVWTGLRFLAGEWHWMSKYFKHIPYNGSLPSCPEEPYRCGAHNKRTQQWEMRDCQERLNFVCY